MDFWCDDAAACVSEAVREDWDAFLADAPTGAAFEVVHDGNVDGLCAAAVARAGLCALGFDAVCVRLDGADYRLPQGVYGRIHLSQGESGRGAETLFCLTCDGDDDANPVRAFALWALFDERCDMQQHAWMAAVALVERHGAQSRMPFLQAAKAKHTAKSLKQILVWLQLAPHAHEDLTADALTALGAHRDARALVRSEHASVAMLRQAEAAILQAQHAAGLATPHLAGRLALVRVRSACQIQALVAQDWSRKLPGYLVMVANEGARDVRIATCSALSLDTAHFVQTLALPEGFATDGPVTHATWRQTLQCLGVNTQPCP